MDNTAVHPAKLGTAYVLFSANQNAFLTAIFSISVYLRPSAVSWPVPSYMS